MNRYVRLASLVAPLLVAGIAHADKTTDRIMHDRSINMGYWPGEAPFSDGTKDAPVGYAVDLCKRVVDSMSAKGKPIAINWVPVNGSSRFSSLNNATIDVLCADTTNSQSRADHFNFSYNYYVASVKVVVRAKSPATVTTELNGKRIAVITGTTGEQLIKNMDSANAMGMTIVGAVDIDAAWKLFASGAVDAIGDDDIILAQKVGTSADYRFLRDPLSVEPYALMMRKSDNDLLAQVNKALSDLYADGDIVPIYNHWFLNDERHVPLSLTLAEQFRYPTTTPSFP
jgi:glutamate/aspartate transport system substrate-binding protein